MVKAAGILLRVGGAMLLCFMGWRMLRDMVADPRNIAGYAVAFFILALPFAVRYTKWGGERLRSRPQLFWIAGGAMIAVAILLLAGFLTMASNDLSLPDVDIFTYGFVFLFGAGFMIFATPTIFAVGSVFKSSKEKE